MAVTQSLTLTESDVNTSANTSKVRILWVSTQTGESWNGYRRTAKYYVSINGGAEVEYSTNYDLPPNTVQKIVDLTIIVPHKNNGTGTVKVRTWMDTDISAGVIEQTESLTLTTISRFAMMNSLSCSTAYFDGTITIKYTPKNSDFYNCYEIYADGKKGSWIHINTFYLGQKPTSQQTETVPLKDYLPKIYELIPDDKSTRLLFKLNTYSDSGYTKPVGSSQGTLTLSIPDTDATQPTATMTLAPVSDFTSSTPIYVKGLSKVKATFTNGAGQYGATIASYKLTVEGTNYSSPYTSDYLTGSGSISVKGTVTDSRGFSRTYTTTISVKDYTKPTIDLLTCNTNYFNGTMTYKYTPANAEFYSRCVIALNINGAYTQIKEIKLGPKTATQQTATVDLSESELSVIYNKFPSSTQGTLRFTFRTYVDADYSEQVGTTDYREITLYIPDIDVTKPTATLSFTPVTSLSAPFNTLYIKGKSKVTADLTGGAGKYGATIKSYTVSVAGKGGTPPYTSEYFLSPGSVTITGTVTDSRGYSRTYTTAITVIDYSAPRLIPVSDESEVIAARCDSSGTLSDTGTYLKIKAKRSYSKVISSTIQNNFCSIRYRYKVEGGSYSSWTTILATTDSSDEIVTGALLGTLAVTSSYLVQVQAVDTMGETATTGISLPTERVYMHKAGSFNALGIGKYAEEENTVDIAEEITAIFRGEVQFKSEAWVARALGTNVVESDVNSGRWGGSGVFYRVCAGGKHIYVAFNVSFTTMDGTVRAESETIPLAYRPSYDVYALCPVGFPNDSNDKPVRGIATVSVSPSGRVNIYAVHKLPGATLSTGETVKWIDGYIDYWT